MRSRTGAVGPKANVRSRDGDERVLLARRASVSASDLSDATNFVGFHDHERRRALGFGRRLRRTDTDQINNNIIIKTVIERPA